MTNAEVAKRFAHGQSSGRSAHLFIEGDKIYSYGHHFLIAKRIAPDTFEVNTDTYSQTTTKHQTLVRRELDNICATLLFVEF